jgi:hypothetical protein
MKRTKIKRNLNFIQKAHFFANKVIFYQNSEQLLKNLLKKARKNLTFAINLKISIFGIEVVW